MSQQIKVAETKDVPAGGAMAVEVNGQKVALFHVDGNYYAIADTCTHRGGSLSEGVVSERKVTCPLHGATFDITNGNVLGPPAPGGVTGYKVQVEGSEIYIEAP